MYQEVFIKDDSNSFQLEDFLAKYKEYSNGYFKIQVTTIDNSELKDGDYDYKRNNNEFTIEPIWKKNKEKIINVYYILNGELHCEDGPAFIRKEYNGSRIECAQEQYYKNGLTHRDDGPAETEYRFEKKKKIMVSERYFVGGKLHRDGGPAEIFYDDGAVETYSHYKNGKLHNENGPAKYTCEYGDHNYTFALNDERLLYEDYFKKLKTKLYW